MIEEYPKIMLEIPHQMPARSYIVHSAEDVIGWAHACDGFSFNRWTRKSALDVFEDPGGMPEGLADVLDKFGEAVEVLEGGASAFYSTEDAPKEFDSALGYLLQDFHSGSLLDEEEAREMSEKYSGHQWPRVRSQLKTSLDDLEGWK